MLRREKRPVSMKVVQDAADALLSRRTPPGAPISRSWVRRWLRADRAQARQEGMLKGNAALPSAAPVEAEAEDDNEDSGLEEDAPSDFETTDLNLDPAGHETSSLRFEPIASTNEAVEALATVQST
jgi:hypothetical protein